MSNTPTAQTINLFKYYAATQPLKNVFPYFVDSQIAIKSIRTLNPEYKYMSINPDTKIDNQCVDDSCKLPSQFANPKLIKTPVFYTIKYIDNECNIQLKSDTSPNLITIRIGGFISGCDYFFLNIDRMEQQPFISQFFVQGISLQDTSYSLNPNSFVFEFADINKSANKWYYSKDSSILVNKCCMPFVLGKSTDFYNNYCTTLTYDGTKVTSEACMDFYNVYCKSEDGANDISCACDDNFHDDPNDRSVIARNAIKTKQGGLDIPRSCIIDQCEDPKAFKFAFDQGTCPNICLQAINILNAKDNIIDFDNVRMQMSCNGPNGGIVLGPPPADPNNPNNPNKDSYKVWLIILSILILIIIIVFVIFILKKK